MNKWTNKPQEDEQDDDGGRRSLESLGRGKRGETRKTRCFRFWSRSKLA